MTPRAHVIGDPIDHSLSPVMHNAGYRALGLSWQYDPVHIKAEDLVSYVKSIRESDVQGVSVTLPHKQRVMPLLDELDPDAIQIGAVNTIFRHNNRLRGTNTDWFGALQMIRQVRDPLGKTVVVLGAGGAARAVCYALLQAQVGRLLIHHRILGKAENLAAQWAQAEAITTPELKAQLSGIDILINTTPVGMHQGDQRLPVPGLSLVPEVAVCDAVYRPGGSPLINTAHEVGCPAVSGERMLLWQGVKQFELFTGQEAPVEAMEAALLEALGGDHHA